MSFGPGGSLALLALIVQGCSALPAAHPSAPGAAVRLAVEMEASAKDGPVALLTLENGGPGSIAVTETFGLQDVFFQVEIEEAGGTPHRYPAGSQYELFGDPGYTCLRPGKSLTVRVPLNRWFHLIGGRQRPDQAVPPAPPPYSFALTPGQCRIRAKYLSYDVGRRAGCPILKGPVVSEWVSFVVAD